MWIEISGAGFRSVQKPMGKLKSSDNSLNQHIKLKHPDFWNKMKYTTIRPTDNIYEEDKEENRGDNIFTFQDDADEGHNTENQIDFDKIIDNF